jgi:hypothetical protein
MLRTLAANSSQCSLSVFFTLIVAPPKSTTPSMRIVGAPGSFVDGARLSMPPKTHTALECVLTCSGTRNVAPPNKQNSVIFVVGALKRASLKSSSAPPNTFSIQMCRGTCQAPLRLLPPKMCTW